MDAALIVRRLLFSYYYYRLFYFHRHKHLILVNLLIQFLPILFFSLYSLLFLTGEARFPSFFIHKKITRLEVSKLQVGDTSTKIVYFFSHLDFSMRPLVHRNALAIIDTKNTQVVCIHRDEYKPI